MNTRKRYQAHSLFTPPTPSPYTLATDAGCKRGKTRATEVMIGRGFNCEQLRNWREFFFQPITKLKQSWITFDTQLKTAGKEFVTKQNY